MRTVKEKIANMMFNENDLYLANYLRDDAEYTTNALQNKKDNLKFYNLIKKHQTKKALNVASEDLEFAKEYENFVENGLKEQGDGRYGNVYKYASEGSYEKQLKNLEKIFKDPVELKVAKMIATSHEYKDKPNIEGAIKLVGNYKWVETTAKIKSLQGLDKPVNKPKCLDMAVSIKKNNNKVEPFIVVNKLHGITPQSGGSKILLDGHHRQEACLLLGIDEVPIYRGTYTGNAEVKTEALATKIKNK